ncbi:hypothetical protein EJB05_30047, partial [Eragrostis curvula]
MSWTTPQGWMLIIIKSAADDAPSSSPAFLWNPLTGDKLSLPNISKEHDIPQQCKCLLSHKDPTHHACVVVLFHRTEPDMWCCRVVAGVAYGSWRRYTYNIGDSAEQDGGGTIDGVPFAVARLPPPAPTRS